MRVLSKWIVLLIDVVILSLAACTAPTPAPTRGPASEGLAIYLPAQKIAANEMLEANLSDLELEDKPVLSVDDIITYSKNTHEREAIDRLRPVDSEESAPAWRLYVIAERVYVQGKSANEMAAELGISPRTFHRERRAAVEALATVMWQVERQTYPRGSMG